MIVKDVFKISKGKKAVESKDCKLDRYIQIGDLRSDNNLKYAKPDKKNVICDENDILIAWDGANAGTIGYNLKGIIGSTLAKLTPKVEEIYSPYVGRFLQSKFRFLRENCTGATIPHISRPSLENLKIPLPPLDQQKQIASILDTADSYRQKTKALIKKYDTLTQSLFLDMFGDPVTNPKGWETKKLGSVCSVGSSKRVFVDELVEDGIPFYRGTEVGKLGEGKSIVPTLFITSEHYERLKEHRGIPKQGDLLMPSICPDGRIWVVDNDKEFYFKDGRVLWVEVDSKKINSIYLRYHLKGSFFANYNNIASGTTFAELKIVALKKMNVFYPDMKLQNQFAERVQAIEAQKALAQQEIEKADNLFNSLLQKAFKGELV